MARSERANFDRLGEGSALNFDDLADAKRRAIRHAETRRNFLRKERSPARKRRNNVVSDSERGKAAHDKEQQEQARPMQFHRGEICERVGPKCGIFLPLVLMAEKLFSGLAFI